MTIYSLLLHFFLFYVSFFYASIFALPYTLDTLTIEEKIGQLCLISVYDPDYLPIFELIHDRHIGGTILFKSARFPHSLSVKNKLISIQTESQSQLPIFTSIDHEGNGLGRSATAFPRMMALGYIDDTHLTKRVGQIMGIELKNAGIDIVYGPVLDVNISVENTVIGSRSFSDSRKHVAKHGKAFISGVESAGVIPVAKHFPGHGLTTQDSHVDLPVSNHNKDTISKYALYPFKKNINVPMIMTAHIYYSKLDPIHPATLSKTILSDLLRDDLGYNGVVITDHMDMKAVRKDRSIEEVCLQAILAGADMLMLGGNISQINKIMDALIEAVHNGTLPMSRVNEAVGRILDLKQLYLSNTPNNIDAIDASEHQEIALEVLSRSTHINTIKHSSPPSSDYHKLTFISAPSAASTTIYQHLTDANFDVQRILLSSPLSNAEKWRYISNIMSNNIEATPEIKSLIKYDKPVLAEHLDQARQLSFTSDALIIGIETISQAHAFNQLATEISIPMIALFYGTRYEAPLLGSFCPNIPTHIVAYNNYLTLNNSTRFINQILVDFLQRSQ